MLEIKWEFMLASKEICFSWEQKENVAEIVGLDYASYN